MSLPEISKRTASALKTKHEHLNPDEKEEVMDRCVDSNGNVRINGLFYAVPGAVIGSRVRIKCQNGFPVGLSPDPLFPPKS